MPSAIEIAPWQPTKLEVYVACRSLRAPVPRGEIKALQREKLINGKGDLTPAGKSQIGRLHWLRKMGKVEQRPVQPAASNRLVGITPAPPAPRRYPGYAPRRERRARVALLRRGLVERVEPAKPEPVVIPKPDPLFTSAY